MDEQEGGEEVKKGDDEGRREQRNEVDLKMLCAALNHGALCRGNTIVCFQFRSQLRLDSRVV